MRVLEHAKHGFFNARSAYSLHTGPLQPHENGRNIVLSVIVAENKPQLWWTLAAADFRWLGHPCHGHGHVLPNLSLGTVVETWVVMHIHSIYGNINVFICIRLGFTHCSSCIFLLTYNNTNIINRAGIWHGTCFNNFTWKSVVLV